MIETSLPEIQSVSVAIRDAVAPVFLLTGVGSILSVLVNRLGRAIDRARVLHGMNDEQRAKCVGEFEIIVRRTAWIRRSIGLITLAALSVCASIATLFIEVKMGLNVPDLVAGTFFRCHVLSHFGTALLFERDLLGLERAVLSEQTRLIEHADAIPSLSSNHRNRA